MESRRFVISSANLRPAMVSAWDLVKHGVEGGAVELTLKRPKRSDEQNRKLWAMLRDVSDQVSWFGQELTPEDWKHVFTASLTKQRAVPGIDGGFVVLGVSTRDKSKEWISELIEVIYAFGAEKGVVWSDPSEAHEVSQVAGGGQAD